MDLPCFFSGRVHQGYQQGRLFGLPTANIHISRRVPLIEGVYVGYTQISPEFVMHPSLLFWGRPHALPLVVDPRLEVHILSSDIGELYQKLLGVTIIDFLRENGVFPDEESLREAMVKDVRRAKEYFNLVL